MVLERRVEALACENDMLSAKLESRSRDVDALEAALGVRLRRAAVSLTAAHAVCPLLPAAVEGPPRLRLLLATAAAQRPVVEAVLAGHGPARHVRQAGRARTGGPVRGEREPVETVV